MVSRFSAPKPQMPAVLVDALNRQGRALAEAIHVEGDARGAFDSMMRWAEAAGETVRVVLNHPDVQDYVRAVAEYNAQVRAWRERAAREERGRRHDAEIATVRAARCASCFTVHGPGQVECF